jgi:biopolymer transport protein ExbD
LKALKALEVLMRARLVTVVCLLVCLAIAIPMVAQQRATPAADPLSGTWTGDWGPNAQDRNQVSVELKYDGKKELTGTVKSINYQRPDVALTKSTYTAATNAVHMEADATGRGGAVHYIIDGKLTGTSMAGSWNHDSTKGDFKLTKK